MSVLVLGADPGPGVVAALRAHAAQLGNRTCLVVAAREPVAIDLVALLAAHRANAALLTIAVRVRRDDDSVDALIAGEDGRLMAVQPAPHPDEALSDLADAEVYAIAPAALHHLAEESESMTGDVVPALLAWDAPVYLHPLDD